MSKTTLVLRVDYNSDRQTEEVFDSKIVDLQPYGIVVRGQISKRVIPWHRIHEIRQGA